VALTCSSDGDGFSPRSPVLADAVPADFAEATRYSFSLW